jgi:hypothetical protein
LGFLKKRYTGEKHSICRVFVHLVGFAGGSVEQRYESIPDIMKALRKRRIQVSRGEVESGLEYLGLREPFGPGDVADLIDHLGPQHAVNRRIIRTQKVLFSKEWADAVLAVRLDLGLPSHGLSEDESREIHTALLENFAAEPPKFFRNLKGEVKPVALFWKDLVSGTRMLSKHLGIDPRPLDNLRASYASGTANMLLRVRKLLDPEGVLKVGGMECRPSQTDYLLAHVLWGLPLDPKIMEPKPAVSFQWIRLADGGGRFISHIFNEQEAAAAELRELKARMRDIKRITRDCLLLAIPNAELRRGVTWDQRWQQWNQRFPDFAFLTPGAFRKACGYAFKNRETIRSRFQKLMQPAGPGK